MHGREARSDLSDEYGYTRTEPCPRVVTNSAGGMGAACTMGDPIMYVLVHTQAGSPIPSDTCIVLELLVPRGTRVNLIQ